MCVCGRVFISICVLRSVCAREFVCMCVVDLERKSKRGRPESRAKNRARGSRGEKLGGKRANSEKMKQKKQERNIDKRNRKKRSFGHRKNQDKKYLELLAPVLQKKKKELTNSQANLLILTHAVN